VKIAKHTVSLALIGVLFYGATTPGDAAQAKNFPSQRGGKADSHMSRKGSANSNPQWSADPERGWVRAEERHELNGERDAMRQRSQSKVGKNRRGNR
jgi:hypothetical protein